ncbi:STOREKEEPER protein-like [Benincasa hispida]|uniref:STOREKEEPER protein-like n=1 Tax=Benincasa hispida TaxID=102211 RepID=UPI001901DA0D|nr:STOREKEEPER protein-like [Benincasa hispida]XP_038889061.1 STOREKEEPER protein-like [Benincasa hispida]
MAPKRLVDDLPSAHAFSDAEEESDYETHEDPEIDNLMQNSEDENEEHAQEDEEEEHEEREHEQEIRSPIISKCENSLEKNSGFVSDSDSEKTQSSPSASAFTIKPILRKLACESSKPKKGSHKSSIDCATVKPVSSGSKRPIENYFQGNESNKKKIKRLMNGEDIEEGKKVSGSGMNRLWSVDDEISILQGMIDFRLAKGSDPYTDMSLFLDFIKENLSVDVSKNQLIDKVRRLKQKYKTNLEKGRNGDDPVFLKQHEHKSFVLAKKIWGNEAKKKPRKQSVKASNSVSISSPRVDVEAGKKEIVNNNNVESKILPEEFLSEYPWLKASFMVENDKFCSEGLMRLVRERMPSIGSEKAKELDDKWRKLGESELELYVKKIDLVREQCKLILDSMGKAKKAT